MTLEGDVTVRSDQPKRVRLSGAERREGLLRAARIVFQEYGLAGARTKRIAEMAGTSEAILYRHFTSKDELFEAAVLEPVEAMLSEIAESAETMGGFGGIEARREASYKIHETILYRMQEVGPLLGTALFSDLEAGTAFYRQRLEPLLDKLDKALADSLLTWKHRPVSAEMINNVQLGTYFWIALQQYFGTRKINPKATCRELVDIWARAI
jgi:AcrR family transcriptional regulator